MNSRKGEGLLGTVLKHLRGMARSFQEKPVAALDECELEHFLLYHGLIGSTPENQRQFRDVRADIIDAVRNRSSVGMVIALKLSPQWWEDRLKTILSEISHSDRQGAIDCLLPQSDDDHNELGDPLRSDDWRVRANAAAMLASLEAKEAVPRLETALKQALNDPFKPSFCHISWALGRLKTEAARVTLRQYLFADEPWFRVDAARALALWPFDEVAHDLSQALFAQHRLSDYMAVAVARNVSAAIMLDSANDKVAEGALEMLIGVVAASESTLGSEIVVETGVHELWPSVRSLYREKPGARPMRANLSLARWMSTNPELVDDQDTVTQAELFVDELGSIKGAEIVLKALSKSGQSAIEESERRHAIVLSAELGINEAAPLLIAMLDRQSPLIDETVRALGRLEDGTCLPALVALAESTVDIDDRTSRQASKHPVVEEDPQAARTYWEILRALGQLPGTQAIPFLIKCSSDFAADKRQQALASLISAASEKGTKCETTAEIESVIARALHDSSPEVAATALTGVGAFRITGLIPDVLKMAESKQTSVRNKSFAVLETLSAHGGKEAVLAALKSKARSELNPNRRERLITFIENLP